MTPAPERRRARIEPINRKGWMKLRRGLPETEGDIPTSDAQWNYERLISRVNANGAWLLVYVLDRTQSAFGGRGLPPPEYARIDIDETATFLNVSPRHVRGIIQSLVRLEVLAPRCRQDPWSLKALPENFEKLPVLGATKRPGRPGKPRLAAAPAPTSIAAYRQISAATPSSTIDYPPIAVDLPGKEKTKIKEMDFPGVCQEFASSPGESQANKLESDLLRARVAALTDAALTAEHLGHPDVRDAILQLANRTHESQAKTVEIQFRGSGDAGQKSISASEKSNSEPGKFDSAGVDVNFRDPEMHCPLNLCCPYLANDLADDKPVTLISIISQPAGRLAGPTFEEVKAYLGSPDLPRWFEDMPTDRIHREVHANLQGAPLELLKRRIDKRGPDLRSAGAIPLLAKDVGDRWKAGESERIEEERLQWSSHLGRLRETVLNCREQLHGAWESFQQFAGDVRTLP